MTIQRHDIRLAVRTLRTETQNEAQTQKLLTLVEQIIPQGPRIVKETLVAWMAHETLLNSAEYSACVTLLMRVWNFSDIESLVKQEKVNQANERATDEKAMLPKIDPLAAKIAALEAQLLALKSGKPLIKTIATPRSSTPETGSQHELQRKMYSLGYSVKQRALKAGKTESEAEFLAVEAKVNFAQENGLEYKPTTPFVAQATLPVLSASLIEEEKVEEIDEEQVEEDDEDATELEA